MALIITRKPGESVKIAGESTVRVVATRGERVLLQIDAPPDVPIWRGELVTDQTWALFSSGRWWTGSIWHPSPCQAKRFETRAAALREANRAGDDRETELVPYPDHALHGASDQEKPAGIPSVA